MALYDFQRLLGIITELNQSMEITKTTIAGMQNVFSQTGSEQFNRSLAQQKLRLNELRDTLESTKRAYDSLLNSQLRGAAGTAGAGANYIPTPKDQPPVTRANESSIRSAYLAGLKPSGVPDIQRTLSERERAEREAIESVKGKIQAERRYANVLKIATEHGFTIDDLQRARSKGTAGIEEFRFSRYDRSGVQQQLDLVNTPAGRTTAGIGNQFRTFGQGVLRDIGELTKWSLALAAVYGPMRKLQELTEIMIENQTKLAEATISVGSSFLDESGIFTIAADSAEQAGESIGGVIDAFTQAYRATGGAGDQVERLSTAQNLLSDSLILSKLSTLDQASAIDTLSAALRQTGGDLNGGTELLDKWVRVTKVANVDLASLATGFAVLGDAAEAAQIDTDQLNGILAAIGETGVASGRELANTARAIVAGFQSDNAREALENIGIAVEDTTGQMRPFLEIMKELSDLRQQKVIDDTTFSKLTLALGGGTRRQAAYATFIENFGRVGEVAAESARASGDAQAALAKQLETVQTSLTRLGNAFQELAQTLGTEGGFLGIITEGVNGMTSLVKVFDSLTSVLGKATPALAAFIAASLVLKQQGRGGIQQALFGVGQGLQPDEMSQRLNQVTGYTPPGQRTRQFVGTNVLGTNASSGAIQGLVMAAIPALLNATNKEDRFGGTKAAADIVGGVGGGVIGALVAGSPVVGAAIGTAVSEAFVNATIARKTDIFGYTAPEFGKPGAENTPNDLDEALRQAEINLYESIGFGNEGFGRLLTAGAAQTSKAFIDKINEAIANQDEGGLKRAYAQMQLSGAGPDTLKQLEQIGLGRADIQKAFEDRKQIEFNPEYLAYQQASPEAQKAFREAEAARLAKGGTTEDAKTAFSQLVADNKEAFAGVINYIKESSKGQLSSDRVSGKVTGAEYGRRFESLGGFDVRALQYYTALGDRVSDLSGDADTAAEAFQVLNNAIVYGSDEALPQLTSISGEIQEIVNLLSDPALNKDALAAFGGAEGATQRLDELRGTLANLINDTNQQALLSRLDIPNVQGDITKPLTQQEFGQVNTVAKQLQDEFYQGFLQIPDDMYDALKGSWDEWAQIVEDSGKTFYETVSEIDPQFFQQAMQQLIEQGKLASQQTNPFGIQQVDMSSKEAGNLQGTVDYFSNYLSQNFPQYEQNPEDVGIIFNDYVTATLHGDNLAIKLALEKLVDLGQKQLDGMYNIPEGATFWVPLTAAYYRPKAEDSLAGGLAGAATGADSTALDGAAGQLSLAAATLQSAGLTLLQSTSFFSGQFDTESVAQKKDGFFAGKYSAEDVLERYQLKSQKEDQYKHLLREYPQGLPESADSRSRESAVKSVGGELPGMSGTILNIINSLLQKITGGGFSAQSSAQQVNPQVNARLDLRVDNNTQLMVDGRVLASVITPYLSSDLLRLEQSQGTVTKRYII
jgi:TP901 family phage tail tape measure protein